MKITSLILALALMLSFAGCGQPEGEKEEVTEQETSSVAAESEEASKEAEEVVEESVAEETIEAESETVETEAPVENSEEPEVEVPVEEPKTEEPELPEVEEVVPEEVEQIEYDTVTIHAPSDPLPYEDFKDVFLPKVLDASKTYGQSPEGYERMVIECEPLMLKQYEWRYNEDGLREYKIGRVKIPDYEEWLTAENLLAHITFFDVMVEETGVVDMSTHGYDVEGW